MAARSDGFGRDKRGSWLSRLTGSARPPEPPDGPAPSAFAILSGQAESRSSQSTQPTAMPGFTAFEVVTGHGTRLAVERATGTLRHVPRFDPAFGRVLACIPVDRPDLCLLVARDETGLLLQIADDAERDGVVSLRTAPVNGRVRMLSHPVSGALACADEDGRFVTNRIVLSGWEMFEFVPVDDVPEAARETLGATLRLLPAFNSVRAVFAALRDGAGGVGLRPLLRTLRQDEVEWLGRMLGADLQACKALAALFPDDIWARQALPNLAALANVSREAPGTDGRPGFVRHLDTSYDTLASLGWRTERWRSLPQACNMAARCDRPPTRTVCVLTTVRDEGVNLIEWLAFHIAIGVEAFFIYSNDLNDGSDELLRALAEAGVLNWITSVTGPGISPQFKAYGHALQLMPEILDYRWAGFIDLDEFVVVDPELYPSLPAFLQVRETDEVDTLGLNWVLYTSNGQTARTPAPVIERFTAREATVDAHIKSFLRPHRFTHAMPHHPYHHRSVKPVARNAAGVDHRLHHFSDVPQDAHAFVAHYFYKSAEEFILRRSMSRADIMGGTDVSPARFDAHYAQRFFDQHHGQPGVPDDRVLHYMPAVHAEMARLRALPGVEPALARIEQLYGERLGRLRRMVSADERFQRPGSTERWFAEAVNAFDGADATP